MNRIPIPDDIKDSVGGAETMWQCEGAEKHLIAGRALSQMGAQW